MKKKYPPWQQTYTGKIVEMTQLNLNAISIRDIAHALSMQCRFAGHLSKFYSVAEHSCWTSEQLRPDLALWGLMHDAAEAYITDIPTYVKDCVPAIRDLERYVLGRIAIKFNLPTLTIPREVKVVDLRMLRTEKEQFYPYVRDWEIDVAPYKDLYLPCWKPEVAEAKFLLCFKRLTK